jgi:hypothetical protein
MSDATKHPRRAILAGLSASVATPAAAGDGGGGDEQTSEPASVLPDHRVDTSFMVLPNPVRDEFEFFFTAGPTGGNGNVMVQVRLKPDQARRIATQILAELEGWSEQVGKAQAAFGLTF